MRWNVFAIAARRREPEPVLQTPGPSMLEQRAVALVDEHRVELEQLVDRELDRALDRLINERIRARNGKPSPALCTVCGERERAANRTVCTRCLERGKRERRAARAAAEGERAVPFAGSASVNSPAAIAAVSSAPSSTTS
jgi:hypothetical protein